MASLCFPIQVMKSKITGPLLSKQLCERTGILAMRCGSKCAGMLSVQSNWLSMNHVAFPLDESIFWYLAQQQQIEALLKTSQSTAVDGDFSATGRIQQLFEETFSADVPILILRRKKTNF